jgi:hypothetical protein
MQGEMVNVFRHDDVREHAFARERFLDRLWWGGRFDHPRVAMGARILRADRFDHHEAGWLVLELFRYGLPDARLRLFTRTAFLCLRHVDLDPSARQVRWQRVPPRGASPFMGVHRRVARVHLDRLGHRARFVGELLERELELARVDAFGFLPKHPLTKHVELMPQRRVFPLDLRQLVVQRGNQRAGGGEISDVRYDGRVRHAP